MFAQLHKGEGLGSLHWGEGEHCRCDSVGGHVIILPQHGEHYRMELFEEGNFSGQCVELCDDCPFLQARGLTKKCVNSIKVYGDGAYVWPAARDSVSQSHVPQLYCTGQFNHVNNLLRTVSICKRVSNNNQADVQKLRKLLVHASAYIDERRHTVPLLHIPPDSWVLYEEPNYHGRMYIVERGNYCTHMEWQAENPNIQSVRRVANYF